jgi:hypothetical protein
VTHAAHPQPRTHGSCVPIERAVLVVMRMKAVTPPYIWGSVPGAAILTPTAWISDSIPYSARAYLMVRQPSTQCAAGWLSWAAFHS